MVVLSNLVSGRGSRFAQNQPRFTALPSTPRTPANASGGPLRPKRHMDRHFGGLFGREMDLLPTLGLEGNFRWFIDHLVGIELNTLLHLAPPQRLDRII